MTKPSLPQGTRDFGAEIVRKRNYIFQTIRAAFELYGFQPLETPAMENLETLMGKYGDEGDKLIFKILNNGLDNPAKAANAREQFEAVLNGKNNKTITERALRYDLTIPFARYVAMNHSQLGFPFKRYQIQPVWRADRPQKGRYREFYQCDADVVGSKSLLNELELVYLYHTVFTSLKLGGYELRINSRKILAALAIRCGGEDKMMDITMAIDKLDKIGLEKVQEELFQRGIEGKQVEIITEYLQITGSTDEQLVKIESLIGSIDEGKKGIEELRYLQTHVPTNSAEPVNLVIDFTLARGLNYYTGIIFEAKAPASVKIGSIGGGGRYDDLTGLFGVPNIPGVGISFGVDRIYDVLEELALFPSSVDISTQVLFFNLGEQEAEASFSLMQELRKTGVRCELFHEQSKFDKQFKYAERKNIPYIIIIGSAELAERTCMVKTLSKGTQEKIAWADLVRH
ncbi:MAG TPA: histidine--tRNA ligase, partial [Flavitalea sp.]|nr:histidine--tRNA ligase [Flavitalea sp.]